MGKNIKGNRKKKKRFRPFKTLLLTLLCLIFLGIVALGGVTLAIVQTSPNLDVSYILDLGETSTIYDSNNKFMDEVITKQKRKIISLKDVPDNLKNAFVSIEDERFYKHNGIDIKRILGALYIDIKNKVKGHSSVQGASTITQQLLKNRLFLSDSLNNRVSIKRKIQEMYLAIKLEKSLTKDQILEAYMNTIYLGGRANGVEAAANQYFNKSAKNLNLVECAFIAGINQSPSRYYPFSQLSKKNPNTYLNRTKVVLYKMYENGYISSTEYKNSIASINKNKIPFNHVTTNNNSYRYPWFSEPTIEQVKRDLKAQYHYTDDQVQSVLINNGLKIYTSMDTSLQNATQKILNSDGSLGVNSTKNKFGILQPEASAVIIDYHTGQVKAIVGGRGAQPPRSYNRAASNIYLRAPGSSIKPITVYGAAIDSRSATASTMVEDSPLSDDLAKTLGGSGKPYNPKNSPNVYYGYVTLREAIMHSINVVAVKLEHQIGLDVGAQYAQKFGISLNNSDKKSIAAISLGEIHGTNPLTMAAAYGVFGNNGLYTEPKYYTKVVDKTGKVLLESTPEFRKVISAQSAYIIYDMLKGPVSSEGTGPAAVFSDMPVRGKTGTSSNKNNLWFCGLTPYYSGAVWIGNDDYSQLNGLSSNDAARVWGDIMKEAHKSLPVKNIKQPSGLVTASVCSVSGKLATDLCASDPRGSRVYTELFLPGTVPTAYCDLHVQANVNKYNGKLASGNTPSDSIVSRVFIRRNYSPYTDLLDQQYVLPSSVDDAIPLPKPVTPKTTPTTPTKPSTKPNNNNNTTPENPPVNPNDNNNSNTDNGNNQTKQ